MTFEEALARFLAKTTLTAQNELELRDAIDNDPGGVEVLMRIFDRQGSVPDRSAWQDFGADLALVEDVAGKLGPVVGILIAVAVAL